MPILSILAAGLAGWAFGAIWYSVFAKPWIAASGVETDASGKPANRTSPAPYVISILSALIVAATMTYAFDMLGITTVAKGFTSGLGIGACFAAPWLATNYGFAGRPLRLILIDAGVRDLRIRRDRGRNTDVLKLNGGFRAVPKPSVPALPSHHARQLNMVSVVLTVLNVLHDRYRFTKYQVLTI